MGGCEESRMFPLSGEHVGVTQRIQVRDGWLETRVEGEVVSCKPMPTGSWFAHGKNDRYWLHRLRLRKKDGEIVDLVLDGSSIVEPMSSPRVSA
jgi:hypothetical protein